MPPKYAIFSTVLCKIVDQIDVAVASYLASPTEVTVPDTLNLAEESNAFKR